MPTGTGSSPGSCSPRAKAAERLARGNLAYLGLESFCAPLDRLFARRPLLGVRSAVNTLARALNPGRAPCQLRGVFPPPYHALHQEVAVLEGQAVAAIFTGGALALGSPCISGPKTPGRTRIGGHAGRFALPASYHWKVGSKSDRTFVPSPP